MKDLLMLEAVDESHIVKELIQRYKQGEIYTFLGPVLIAVNPYKLLKHKEDGSSIYATHWMSEFSGKELHLSEAHPFAIAESAYTDMMRFGHDQSLLITGESGSGKTETSKHVMQYLTTISTRSRARSAVIANRRMSVEQRKELDNKITNVTDVLWGSNPVLEAFGNAQTIRNNNSSRFGKYIVLQLNRIGQVIGGYIDNYLLERSRIIHQAEGERNFHAFYQLLAGATEEEREKWHLLNAEEYDFLANEDSRIEGVDDAANFTNVRANMNAVGISPEEQTEIFQQLAAILWIGNIRFRETTDEAHNKIAVVEDDSREALEIAAKLLGIPVESLETMITFRMHHIYGEDQKVSFDKRQAKKVCDSIARSMYENIFNWIVARINKNVACNQREVACSIGILDIYGFEIFEVNAFEQLCINYVNEKLQQLFIAQTLRAEQDEYKREAIAWEQVQYANNQVVCDLIEDQKSHGIFRLLDEQCAIARLSELELIERYNSSHGSNPHYIKSRTRGPNFTIVHYAGKVEYDVTLFFEANVDTFFNDMYKSMAESTVPFVREVFHDKRTEEEKLKRPPSTSQQFRAQVQSMLKKLEGCNPHYIRCIKPNEHKAPLEVNEEIITEQVRYLGLVENLTVRRQGFCYRETYSSFVNRYRFLSKETWPTVKAHSMRKAAIDLLSTAGVGVFDPDSAELVPFEEDSMTLGCYACGRNRIFLKHPQALSTLEILRERKIPEIVNIIENAWRRYKNRLALVKFIAAEKEVRTAYTAIYGNCMDRRMRRLGANDKAKVEALYATWNAVSEKYLSPDNRFARQLKEAERDNGVIFLQSFVRAKGERRSFLRLKQAQVVFSKRYRGLKTRKQMAHEMWLSCKQALLGVRTEFERFLGKKKRRRNSLDRDYLVDYVNTKKYPAYSAILNQRGPQKLLFAADVVKVNERFVHQPRVLVVGEKQIYNLKADKPHQPKERRAIDMSRLSGVIMSTLSDNYVVLQVKSEFDMLLVVDQKTELVTALRKHFTNAFNRELPVKFADEFEFMALKGRPQVIKFKYDLSLKETTSAKVDKRTIQILVAKDRA
ncbi:hypothetical protein Poli38472_014037 [Pythium oligandrum]|uniref:Uncharacterized protein n=1 Tax=Pythium oligandrum TaxID=41045 RepID=A0A8K1CQ83_PYTOL|nr:hypothetical protein Poli38472_014037 [Pythium oligandrum]|eukprot:TMW66725.1 hypothetical protein Poli38472_014037 [Pythium oligandrum]